MAAGQGRRESITSETSDDDPCRQSYAWFNQNSERRTHPVGEKKPNGFGFYDMLGNVHEWNEVILMNATSGAPEPACRGGSWNSHAPNCTVIARKRFGPANRFNNGLRVARVP